METKSLNRDQQRTQTPANVLDVANLKVQRSLLTARIVGSRGEARRALVQRLRAPEVLAFVANEGVSRAVRMAVVASIEDVRLLASIATGTGPIFAKRDALRRIDELRDVHPLSAREAGRLAPCLNDKDLVAAALVVLDESDFDWCACCDASTVSALCAALYQSTSVHESVILEDAYAHLTHSRLDLSASLRACNPEAYLMRTMYAPIDPRSAAFIDLSEKGNVA